MFCNLHGAQCFLDSFLRVNESLFEMPFVIKPSTEH